MAIITALFVGGGHWLDIRQESAPFWTLIGSLLAFVSIGTMLWRVARSLDRKEDS